MSIIEEKIYDKKFTNLIRKALKAGYLEGRYIIHSLSGSPQGSVISPILCNIYMDKLDKFIKKLTLNFNKGVTPRPNPVYIKYRNRKVKAETLEEKLK